jgi:hypothetical protein
MKTSNKILLILFVTALLMITAVHLTLYAKYKKGEVSSFEQIRGGDSYEQALPTVKYVSIIGLRQCHVFPAAEPKIKIFKMRDSRLAYKVVNDTLVIKSDSSLTEEDMLQGKTSPQIVNLYLSEHQVISAYHTELYLHGGPDSVTAPSWTINISKGTGLYTGNWDNIKDVFNQLQIKASGSHVIFNHGTFVNEVSIQTNESAFNDQSADIKHLQLSVDDNSTIVLQGKNMQNINILKK